MDDRTRHAAFDDMFAGLYLQARRLAFAILGDLPTAEDAATEALVRARVRWDLVRDLRHRDTWVLRTAATVAIDLARRRPGASARGNVDSDDPGLVALDRRAVDRLLHLPRRQREVVALVVLAGCSVDAVAATMDTSVTTVEREAERGLDILGVADPRTPDEPAGSSLRSADEVRAFVHLEADRRGLHRQFVLGAAALGLALIAVIVMVGGIIRGEPAAELASTGGSNLETTRSSVARGPPTAASVRTEAGSDDERPADPTATVPGWVAPAAPAGSRRPTANPSRTNGPPRSAPSAELDGPTDATTDGATPLSPPSTAAPPRDTTSSTIGTGTTVTTIAPRPCTTADFGTTDVVWVSDRDGQPYPDHAAPLGEVTWFVVSAWANLGTPCLTSDWRQELTITDAASSVVYRASLDEGPGRLTEPGSWVLYDGWIAWDTTCVEEPPTGWARALCIPVGPGSYTAHLAVRGALPPPLTVTILGS